MSQKEMDYGCKAQNCLKLKRNEKNKKVFNRCLATFANTLLADNPRVVLSKRLL